MVGPFPIPALFFFSAWLLMVFWGMVASSIGLSTISYLTSMLATIGLWLVVFPISRMGGGRTRNWAPVRQSGRRWSPGQGAAHSEPQFDINARFSGVSRRITSKAYRGGRASASFGGVELDLRDAIVQDPPAVVTVRAFFGGVELRVPSDWNVILDVSAMFGGTSDERERPSFIDDQPKLVIRGSAMFGGVTVKD